MSSFLSGRILVTGGAGYLGRAIYTAARRHKWGARFTCYSRDERKQELLRRRFPEVDCVIGDILDPYALRTAMIGHDAVIHAAALKYVPEAEQHVREAIRTNVHGTANALEAAAATSSVRTVIFISTDKAVAPLNVYGMTKALGERLVGEFARQWGSEKRAVAVRYGNVVGSTGSVIPLFRDLAREGKSFDLTSLEMTRFWMAPSDAVAAIQTGLAHGRSGEIIVELCRSLPMVELVNQLAGGKADYKVTGLRPGEKLHESLLTEAEATRARYLVGGRYVAIIPAHASAAGYAPGRAWTSDVAPVVSEVDLEHMLEEAEELA